MTPAERTAKIAELRAEADRLEREGERNWPEKVEAGMLFQEQASTWIADDRGGLVKIIGEFTGMRWLDWSPDFMPNAVYLGHARDLLTIKTPDAPEPTGAELVGKVCEFSDDGEEWAGTPHKCRSHSPAEGYQCACGSWSKFARLAKEQP